MCRKFFAFICILICAYTSLEITIAYFSYPWVTNVELSKPPVDHFYLPGITICFPIGFKRFVTKEQFNREVDRIMEEKGEVNNKDKQMEN